MKYDFTTRLDRSDCGSVKWKLMKIANKDIPKGVLPLGTADMDFYNAPEIMEGIRESLDTTVFGYQEAYSDYLNSVCSWQKRRFGWSPDPSWIQVTKGVVPALSMFVKLLTKEDESVLIMTPCYGPFSMVVKANGRKIVTNSLVYQNGRYEIDFADFEEKAKRPDVKLLLLCSPHNPTGRVWTREELSEIIRICLENDVFIVSDEIHEDLMMPGYQHIPLPMINPDVLEKCAVCTAASKSFNLSGLETANIFIPDAKLRMDFFMAWAYMGLHHATTLGLIATKAAYDHAEPWLEEALNVIYCNRCYVENFLLAKMPKLKAVKGEGTYLIWIDCRELGLDDEALKKFCHSAHVYHESGLDFGPEGSQFIRLNLACPIKPLSEAIERLYEEYQKL